MQIKIQTITPEQAQAMLSRNRDNRPMSQSDVKFYAAQMSSGQWRLTGDTIKISKTGDLLDGQHRLAAIVQYGRPVEIAVATDCEREIFEVLDTGRRRSAADVLAISGFQETTNLAAIARGVILFKAGISSKGSERGNMSITVSNTDVLNFIEQNQVRVSNTMHASSSFYNRCKFLSRSEYGIFYFLFSEKSEVDATDFFEKFASGAGLQEDSPILKLRRKMEQNALSTKKITTFVRRFYILRAWAAFRKNERLSALVYNIDSKMPEII